uniref:flagellar filament capping protein FliD n=1 Tax=Iodobacter sp. TaxID=1915058 RepID=UPI0025F9486E
NDSGKRDAGGAFASDSGIRALRDKLNGLVRQSFDGVRLMDFGVKTDRDGNLSLDRTKLDKALIENPAGLEKIFNASTGTDLIKENNDYLGKWLNASNGLLKARKESVSKAGIDLAAASNKISQQYDQAYQRALKQFTQLKQLQAQMGETSNMFNNM